MTDNQQDREAVARDISGETVLGFRVAAYRETHAEHGDKFGHSYSEHWSTPNSRDPRVKVERLFTEAQLREALTSDTERASPGAAEAMREAAAQVAKTTLGGLKTCSIGTAQDEVVRAIRALPQDIEGRAYLTAYVDGIRAAQPSTGDDR